MAISKLGGADKWVEIGTSSPTSGSTVTFSSISTIYKDLAISIKNVTSAAGSPFINFQFNNDTTNNYGYSFWINTSAVNNTPSLRNNPLTSSFGGPGLTSTTGGSGILLIKGANGPFKEIEGTYQNSVTISDYQDFFKGTWFDTAAITEIDCNLSSSTYAGGTIKLFGRI